MNTLTDENAPLFIARFNAFYDGLLLRVLIDWTNQQDQLPSGIGKQLVVDVATKDTLTIPSPDVVVRLYFHRVSEFRVQEMMTCLVVLSHGITIDVHEQQISFVFEEGLQGSAAYRRADCYIRAEAITWEVIPATDTVLGKFAHPYQPAEE